MPKRVMTVPALADFLRERKGAEFATIVATTDPKALKKHRETGEPNPYARIRKVSRVNGVLGWIYGNSVNLQRKREGAAPDFSPEPRAWGERVKRADGGVSPLVEHKGALYLELKVEKVLDSFFLADGKLMTGKELRHYLPKPKVRESSRQETEKPIILRDYRLDSLREIVLGGETIVMA